MLICLQSWDCLEPHLPVGICPKRTFGNSRPADEAAYQTVLDIAKKHLPVARAGDREAEAAQRRAVINLKTAK